jgi:glutamyl-tRNA synthetase
MSLTGQNGPGAGRFAPSPTGPLHVGNLRTAMAAWLLARSTGRAFVVRMEDLDRVTSSAEWAAHQLAQLAAVGIDWDGEVVAQSDRFDRHHAAIDRLSDAGLTYPCYCTRREIAEAAAAPHGTVPTYPRTCRDLTEGERSAREADGRPAALRLRANGERYRFDDLIAGPTEGMADDIVIRRNDGVPAYQWAVVVVDDAQGIDQVVRGDDLLPSTASQLHLIELLGYDVPTYAHVPLVVGPDGQRLAKRHGALTPEDLGWHGDTTRSWLAASLGVTPSSGVRSSADLVDLFDIGDVPPSPLVFDPTSSE